MVPPKKMTPQAKPARLAAKNNRKTDARSPALRWRVNWPLLIGSFLVVALIAPLAYGWHEMQFNRNASMFLSRADELEQNELWSEALEYLNRYRRAFPEDVEVRVRIARVFDHIADDAPEKALSSERLYSIAVGLAPDRPDLRVRHAERLLETAQYRATLNEVDELVKLEPDNRQASRLRALAAYRDAQSRGDMSNAAELVAFFRAAVAQRQGEPEHIELAIQLAEILRSDAINQSAAEREELADKVIDEMVTANPQRSAAWIGRYLYNVRHKQTGTDADLDRALETDREQADLLVQLAAAERAHARKESAAAIDYYEHAIAAHPKDRHGYLGLAQHLAAERKFEQARDALQRGLANVAAQDQLEMELPLAGMSLATGKLDEVDQILRSATKRLDVVAARRPSPAINKARSELDMLRAQWHMEKQQFQPAIGLFRQALFGQASTTDNQDASQRARSFMQLGTCYAAMRHWDQAGDAFKEAITLQPKLVGARLAAAQAWQSAGRIDEAVREFRVAVSLPEAPVEAWAYLVEAQMRQQLTVAESARDWRSVEQSLAAGKKRFPDATSLATLSTQLGDIRTGTSKTLEIVAQTQAADPKSRGLAERLVFAYESEKQPEKSDEVVRKFAIDSPDKTDVVILRTTLHVLRKQFAEADTLLAEGLAQAPAERKSELQLRQANVAMRLGKIDDARRMLAAVAEHGDPGELLLELLADLALETKNLDDLSHWEEQLQKQEGPDGTAWRFYRAQRLLTQASGVRASDARDPRLAEVEQLIAEIQRIRPRWPTGFLLQAQAAQAMRKPDVAIDAYRKAIALGEKRRYAQEQLISLLYATGKMEEAEKALADLGAEAKLSPRLANIAIALRIQHGDSPRAIEMAQQEVERRPDDPMSHVSLGQTLVAAKQNSQAESAFRKATVVKPQDTRPWQALFGYYLTVANREAARQTLDEMIRAVKLSDRELLPLLAQDQVLLKDLVAAEKSYRKLLEIAPDDATVLLQVADFFVERDAAVAERCLRKAMLVDPKNSAPRLNLAAFLIMKGSPEQLESAAKLLETAPNTVASPAEQGLKARLLLQRGVEKDRERGQQMLEELVGQEQASDNDRIALIGLYEREGRSRKSEEQALALASRKNPNPDHVARYIDLLLSHNRGAEAKPWLDTLTQLAPENWATVSLQARLLATEGKTSEIEPLVEAELARYRKLGGDVDQSRLLLAAATLYGQLQMDVPADRTFRQLAAQSPEGYRPLSIWLASHEQTAEAVEICLQLEQKESTPESATALARALVVGNASRELHEQSEPTLVAAQRKHAADAELLFVLSTWRIVQGQTPQAVELLRKVLSLQPRNSMAMNNLATLLADTPETREEALRLLDQAIAISGPVAELLDSKGMILFSQGETQASVELLDKAVGRPSPDPRHCFHLALALRKDGKLVQARQALEHARQRSLSSAVMAPADRQLLAGLERDLQD